MHANPISAGIVNALIPGLGYLLIRERMVFGTLTLMASVLFGIVILTDPAPAHQEILLSVGTVGRYLEGLSYFIAGLAFGYDAYDLVRRKHAAALLVQTA
ncbi:MAG TPA: hypothetical protein VGB97_01195 [Candidatus Paceibacterota bacterium]|jgi:hypothetical protein